MSFQISWQRKHVQSRSRTRDYEQWFVEAHLIERKLVDGRPQMQLVCRLASISEVHANSEGAIAAREQFWSYAAARLGRLTRLSDRDLDEIEQLIARRVPKPSPLPQAAE
jgi:hypothetical protein